MPSPAAEPQPSRLGAIASHVRPPTPSDALGSPEKAATSRPVAGRGGEKRLRIAVGKLQQETNDLSPIPTTEAYFRAQGFLTEDEVFGPRGREGIVDGFITAVEGWEAEEIGDIELVGLAHTAAWAAGRLTRECWQWLLDEYLGRIAAAFAESAGGLDGIFLALHGAMVIDGEDDPEGYLLERIRDIVGPAVPVVCAYDLHLHLTPRMCTLADATVIFHTSPHIDNQSTGARSAAAMAALLRGAVPATAYTKLPLNLPVERANTQPPPGQEDDYAAFPPVAKAALIELERQDWCLAAGISYPQPWMNLEDIGAAIAITADASIAGATSKAESAVANLAERLFDARHEFMPTEGSVVPYVEAVERAFVWHSKTRTKGEDQLVVIGDGVDSTNAGAPGDSNWIISELLKYNWPLGGAMAALVSSEAVSEAEVAGEGNALHLELGGKRDTSHKHAASTPIMVHCIVEKLFDARFTIEAGHCAGIACDLGRGAALRITNHAGQPTNVCVVCTSGIGAHFAAELFQRAGLDPWNASVLVAKSPAGYRATYGKASGLMMTVESPGCAPPRYWLPAFKPSFDNIRRPLFPWDNIVSQDYDKTVSIFSSALVEAELTI